MSYETGPPKENDRLNALTGRWRSHGRTVAADGEPPIEISGTDDYTWLAGGFFLVHRVDVLMGGDRVEAVEMIGPYDPETDAYPARSFDNAGNFTTMRASVTDDGGWTFAGENERATLTIEPDGQSMTARWERTSDGREWTPWMNMTFTRT
ncbi:DUF1579 family protein [Nonomuraea sp. NN258]|uniref:DUF1579 family protein n=1 Tax=Nonomuraea antri TaxID=2730852 RepID=UPI001569C22C|nr:DUF1579 family protein [Nonomuraea antri]NRQ39859.1 DUF1579 family protein [Nonomuraea antri]